MSETTVSFFTNNLTGVLPKEWIILLISMIPILELRGGILVASLLHMNLYQAVIISIIGNMIPIPFILLFITRIFKWMKTKNKLRSVVEWLENKSKNKSENIQKYEFLGLLFFVGIPLPGTGAWTGALIAALLRIKNRKAIAAIICGVCMASALMVLIAYGIPAVIRLT
ncbi:hypothetical protein lbkm_1453 [Lachnospiraceae bacterium KM106-2]|nr:hypothetical protein lbkm_1453 [Lachnospiraceae bacterium KM106-2]